MSSYTGALFVYFIIYMVQALVWGWATQKIIDNKGYNETWFWWGFFFGFIAVIVALTKPNVHEQQSYQQSLRGNYSNNRSSLSKANNRTPSGTEWACAYCNRINQAFVGTCACGHSRIESEEKRRRDQENSQAFLNQAPTSFDGFVTPLKVEQPVVFSAETNQAQSNSIDTPMHSEEEKIDAIRRYKSLMDDGIITQEEFEAKKKNLLGL